MIFVVRVIVPLDVPTPRAAEPVLARHHDALVGRLEQSPLDPELLERGLAQMRQDPDLDPRTWLMNIPLAAYAGNVGRLDGRLASAPVNTDDRTVLEYMAPVTERNSRGSVFPSPESP